MTCAMPSTIALLVAGVACLPLLASATVVAVDTDVSVDDVAALCVLSAHVRLQQVTTVTGVSRTSVGCVNAARLLTDLNLGDVPVYEGADNAYQGGSIRRIAEAMADQQHWPPPQREPIRGHQASAEAIAALPKHSVLLCLGPLTNVAAAVQIDRTLIERIDAVHIMGGAFDFSEPNFAADVKAAAVVLKEFSGKIVLNDALVTSEVRVHPVLRWACSQPFIWRTTAFMRFTMALELLWHQSPLNSVWDAVAAAGYINAAVMDSYSIRVKLAKNGRLEEVDENNGDQVVLHRNLHYIRFKEVLQAMIAKSSQHSVAQLKEVQ